MAIIKCLQNDCAESGAADKRLFLSCLEEVKDRSRRFLINSRTGEEACYIFSG